MRFVKSGWTGKHKIDIGVTCGVDGEFWAFGRLDFDCIKKLLTILMKKSILKNCQNFLKYHSNWTTFPTNPSQFGESWHAIIPHRGVDTLPSIPKTPSFSSPIPSSRLPGESEPFSLDVDSAVRNPPWKSRERSGSEQGRSNRRAYEPRRWGVRLLRPVHPGSSVERGILPVRSNWGH